MSITQEYFCGLPIHEQLQVVLTQGTFRATRYEDTYAITQYQVSEFSADLYYSSASTMPEQIQVQKAWIPPAK
ncbi:hypothetical protein [Hymenobacter cellulosilyticus]|uniref:Uncharacterized protein n=1 Tax=Hymenobacter cellulosilyticus TaxID=2932248 RepID=A0A8T9Q5F1_9BACT|nr:hypothetical protein [Hymenobacter cellulosilyticus]UOQ70699.1 hypothetical protein MUN79_18625 [Hymenobacter cellulosilyticus]